MAGENQSQLLRLQNSEEEEEGSMLQLHDNLNIKNINLRKIEKVETMAFKHLKRYHKEKMELDF